MELMNILRGGSAIQVFYEYDGDDGVYRFDNDIKINGWTIARLIRIGGPKYSIYKYDLKNYLEFVITDKDGVTKERKYYHNDSDEIVSTKSYEDNTAERGIRRFLENHPIFDAENWEDFEACQKLQEIEKLLNSEMLSAKAKLESIKTILTNVKS